MHDTPYVTHMTTPPTAAAPANELFDALRLELRRGCLVVAVLAQLKSEQYGYTLRKSLFDDGLIIDESTLYPLLRRLESQGLLLSEWREENKRNKRFYRLSPSGAQVLAQLLEEWRRINASIDRMVEPEKIQAQQFTREQRVHDQRAQDEHTPDQNAAQFAQILKES
jgi:PadR family transcriptional regulator PadR